MQRPSPGTFDSIDEILSPRTVENVTSLNASTIWRMRQRHEFPQPIRLSAHRVGYRREDIRRWLASRETAQRRDLVGA